MSATCNFEFYKRQEASLSRVGGADPLIVTHHNLLLTISSSPMTYIDTSVVDILMQSISQTTSAIIWIECNAATGNIIVVRAVEVAAHCLSVLDVDR